MAMSAENLQGGLRVETYKLLRPVSRGRASESWLALDGNTGRHVVFTYYASDRFSGSQLAQQFIEAVRGKVFEQKNLLSVVGAGELKERPFLVFEHVVGESLRERMRAGLLPWGEVLRIGEAVSEGLVEAHKRNLFHHDIKPERVLLGRDGSVKLADTAVARIVQRALQAAGAGAPNTNDYVAPELLKNDAAAAAADVWALGCLLFELTSGQPPYFARVPQMFLQEVSSADKVRRLPTQPRQAPLELQELIYRCLDKAAAKRPPASEVHDVLKKLRARGADPEANPFPGLQPFDQKSAAFFLGRDAAITACVEHLQTRSLLVIAGPPGVGKTSLAEAGIAPRLEPDYELLKLEPGRSALAAFAAALLDGGDETTVANVAAALLKTPELAAAYLIARAEKRGKKQLLVVDRLEDLCLYDASPKEVHAFLKAIAMSATDRADPIRVVCVMAQSFAERLCPGLGLEPTQVFALEPMPPEEIVRLMQAIVTSTAHDFDDASAWRELEHDLVGDRQALAKASFLIAQLVARRDASAQRLKRSEYETFGGPSRAMERYAEWALGGASAEQKHIVRSLCFRLASEDEVSYERTRAELLERMPKGSDQVLDKMAEVGLFSVRGSGEQRSYKLVHDALVDLWPTLRAWLDERRSELGFLAQMQSAAVQWEKAGKKGGLKGEPLHIAAHRIQSATQSVSPQIKAFVDAGLARELRARVAARTLVIGIWVCLGLLALGTTFFAVRSNLQKRNAEAARDAMIAGRADAEREDARSAIQKLKQGKDGTELVEARAQVRASLEREDSTLARTLWAELEHMPLEWKRAFGLDVHSVGFAGERVLFAKGTTLYIVDRKSGMPTLLRNASDGRIRALAASSAEQVALAEGANRIRLHSLATGQSTTFDITGGATALAYSPDAQTLAVATKDAIKVVNLTAPQDPRELKTGSRLVAFSSDGQTLAALANDKTVVLIDIASGAAKKTYEPLAENVTGLAFAGEALAVSLADGTVREVDGKMLFRMEKDAQALGASPDGAWLGVIGDRGQATLLRRMESAEKDAAEAALPPSDDISVVAISRDTSVLVTAGEDPAVHLWDTRSARVSRTLSGHSKRVNVMDMSADGSLLATGGPDGTIHVWAMPQGNEIKQLTGGGFVKRLKFVDKKTLVSGHADGRIRTWNLLTAKAKQNVSAYGDLAMAISPDGKKAMTAGSSGPAQLWKVLKGSGDRTISPSGARFTSATYSPDSKNLVTADSKGKLQLWEEKGPPKLIGQHEGAVHQVVHDGKRVYSASADRSIGIWDPSGEGGGGARISEVGFEPKAIAVSRDGSLLLAGGDKGALALFRLPSGDPFWRAPLLLRKGPELATHAGFLALGAEPVAAADSAWRKAVIERARMASEASDGSLVCFVEKSKLELWSKSEDKALVSADVTKVDDLGATPKSCVSRTGGIVTLYSAGGEVKGLSATASAIGVSEESIAIADGTSATIYGFTGEKRSSHTIPSGASAIVQRGDMLVLGFDDGGVERVPLAGGAPLVFATGTSSRVLRLTLGPLGTVAAADQDGEIALWDATSGRLLSRASVFARPSDLVVSGKGLYAASIRGNSTRIDMSPFEDEYCALLQRVWQRVPLRWSNGRASVDPPPKDHRCAQ